MNDEHGDTIENRRYGRRYTRGDAAGGWKPKPGLWHLMVRPHIGGETVCGGRIYAANPRQEEYVIAPEPPEGKTCRKCVSGRLLRENG